jgi:hypothetical protein
LRIDLRRRFGSLNHRAGHLGLWALAVNPTPDNKVNASSSSIAAHDVRLQDAMIRLWLHRLLPILAILGMVLAPIAAPSGAGAMAAETVTMESHASISDPLLSEIAISADMPCCPHEKPMMPDCGKATCPLMALCSAKDFPNGCAAGSVLPLPVMAARLIGLRAETQPAGLAPSPPTRPPLI